MRKTLVAVVLFALAACAPPNAGAPDEAAMIEAARAVDQEFQAAFNRGDAAGVSAVYWQSPEVVLMAPDGTLTGIDAIRASWETAFASGPGPQIELLENQYRVAGDHVIAWGSFRMNVGGGVVLEGRTTEVLAERDGRWVYVIDHASVPLPPPPGAPAPAGDAAAHGG